MGPDPVVVILSIVSVIIVLSIVFLSIYIYGNKNDVKKPKDDFKEEIEPLTKLEPSSIVKQYPVENPGSPTSFQNIEYDSDGRRIIYYYSKNYVHQGEQCKYNYKDIENLKKIVSQFFGLKITDKNKKLIETKVSELMDAKTRARDGKTCVDYHYFMRLDSKFAFIFRKIKGEKFSEDLEFFCKTRADKIIKLPETKYSTKHNNNVAIFDLNKISERDLRLLSYLQYKNSIHKSFKMVEAVTRPESFFNKEIKFVHTKDCCLEYFYKILKDSYSIDRNVPNLEIHEEIFAREMGYNGWPKQYENSSYLMEFYIEMTDSGIKRINNKKEILLYKEIKKLCPDAIYQYRDYWLEPQSIDIFIPSLRVAIEYQGAQHYKQIEHFGGKLSYEDNQRRDKEKKEKCSQNNVLLLEWPYKIEVSKESIKRFFKRSNINVGSSSN